MKKLVLLIIFVLSPLVVNVESKASTAPNTVGTEDSRISGCQDISPKFKDLQYKEFVIPAGSEWSQCLKFINHTDEVGLLFERASLEEYSQSYIEIIPPYARDASTKKYKDIYPTIKVKPASVRRAIINLTDEAGVEVDATIVARFSLTPAHFDRKMIVFYELTGTGSTLASIAIVENKNVDGILK